MKRCPQCEFVYEDEQTVCDMDGSNLAFDSRPLPKLQVLTNHPEVPSPKGFWRGRLITGTAGLVLATVLGLVYYVSTHPQSRPQVIPAAQSQQVITPQVAADSAKAEAARPTESNDTPAAAENVTKEAEAKAAPTPKLETVAEVTPSKKKRPANLNTPQPQPVKPASVDEKPKKESKVGAILKKTGRLLKKPFKL